MIEPRGIGLHLHRRENSQIDSNNEALTSLIIEHDEPERPIHPALEYEILALDDDNDDSSPEETQTPPEPSVDATKWDHKTNLKLLLSCIFLVISGTGNVVAMKLQAIPM
jgi:hypothetical protein